MIISASPVKFMFDSKRKKFVCHIFLQAGGEDGVGFHCLHWVFLRRAELMWALRD